MPHRSPLVTLSLLALLGCGTGSTIVGVDVDQVVVTPSNPSVDVGATVQFQAQALDAAGAPVTGQTLTWSSSSPSVATIDNLGVATGVAAGTTSITATIGGQSSSQILTVNQVACVGRVDVSLAAGATQSYAGDTCLLLPSGTAGDLYRVAVVRPTLVDDSTDVVNVTLATELVSITAATAAPSAAQRVETPTPRAADAPRLDGTLIARDMERKARTRAYHEELRRSEREQGLYEMPLLPSLKGPHVGFPGGLTSHPAPPPRLDLFLDRTCTGATSSPVIRVGFNDDLVIYQDSVEWAATPLGATATTLALDYYTDHVKDMLAAYWGPTPDTDGNGRLVMTTTSSLPGGAAAAVWSGDFVSTASCPGSNEGEVMYFAPDVLADLEAAPPSYFGLGVIAHEAKHVTSIYNSVQRGDFLETWIEEGTAEISQVMSSRIAWASIGGPAVGARVTDTNIFATGQVAENWGALVELGDVIASMTSEPNSLVTDPVGHQNFHTFYAHSWQLHRLIGDAWGGASTPFADSTIFRTLTDQSTPGGSAGLLQVTGSTFDALYEDMIVAISTHMTGVSATREFTTWDLVSSTDVFASPAHLAPLGLYPWPVTTTATAAAPGYRLFQPYSMQSYSGPIGPSGARYHDFQSEGTAGLQVLVSGATTGRIIVTRLN